MGALQPYYQDKNSTLYFGDNLEVLPHIPSSSIDCIITDPPYVINFESSYHQTNNRGETPVHIDRPNYFKKIIGDDTLKIKWLMEAYRVLKSNTAIYIFCHWSKWGALNMAVEIAGFKVRNMIVLHKSNSGMGDLQGSYAPSHELMLYATKGRHILLGHRKDDVWDVSVFYSARVRAHPNRKPESWVEPCVLCSCPKGGIILDPFAGSGSFGVCATKHGRKYIGIEIDEQYVKVCHDRLEGCYIPNWKEMRGIDTADKGDK